MAHELKQSEGVDSTSNVGVQLKTSTPIKLFCKTKMLNVCYDTNIIKPTAIDGWYHIGFDCVIQSKQKITIAIKPLSLRNKDERLYFTLGFATKGVICSHENEIQLSNNKIDTKKGVIHTNGNYNVGMFINGWDYHSNGNVYCDNRKRKTYCPIALNQTLRLEIEQYKINAFVQNKIVMNIDKSNMFAENKDKQFYPCLSVNGSGSAIQIVDFKIQ
eukprot:44573_1